MREEFWEERNRNFAVAPRSAADYHRKLPRGVDLDQVFSLRQERVLSQDWVVRYGPRLLQVEAGQRVGPGQKLVVEEQRTGKLRLLAGGRELRWHAIASLPPRPQPPARQPWSAKPHKPAADHPWRQPTPLGNPAVCAGFPLFHRRYGGWCLTTQPDTLLALKTGHLDVLPTPAVPAQGQTGQCFSGLGVKRETGKGA
ncbi:MAG: hypothetical protein ACRD1L_14110 [Terriglobales bacterium]